MCALLFPFHQAFLLFYREHVRRVIRVEFSEGNEPSLLRAFSGVNPIRGNAIRRKRD